MAKTTISFTIDEDQLQAVDAMAENTRLNRSAMLGVLIEAGIARIKRPVMRYGSACDEIAANAVRRHYRGVAPGSRSRSGLAGSSGEGDGEE